MDLHKLRENVSYVVEKCKEEGISVSGVIKGVNGDLKCAGMFAEGGCRYIASSRLEQIQDCREAGIDLPMMLIRIPMKSETEDVVRLADYSLNSEPEVLRALNEAAERQEKIHRVILMADLGDLREGFWDKEDLVNTALWVERELDHLELSGVGTNVGCYGSVQPTEEKLQELVRNAGNVERAIGRPLEIVSGGATSSFMRIMDGNIPDGINHLRIGEQILLARDLDVFYGYDVRPMHQDVFTFEGEVIEVKNKPSYPVGEIGVDAFGRTPHYEDKGIRTKVLIACGKVDYGDPADLFPRDSDIVILGASSDHTILDVTDCSCQPKIGDILDFDVDYASLVYLTSSRSVQIQYV